MLLLLKVIALVPDGYDTAILCAPVHHSNVPFMACARFVLMRGVSHVGGITVGASPIFCHFTL